MGGGDKTLLDLGGKPLVAHIIAALSPLRTAINANGDPARFSGFGLPVFDDGPWAGNGPLSGVRAALAWATAQGAESVLTVPGDTPMIPPGLAATLFPSPACARSEGQAHHLVALWPVGCAPALDAFLAAEGSRRVVSFTERIGMRPVDFATGKWDAFHNVNVPDDLATIRRAVGNRGTEGAT